MKDWKKLDSKRVHWTSFFFRDTWLTLYTYILHDSESLSDSSTTLYIPASAFYSPFRGVENYLRRILSLLRGTVTSKAANFTLESLSTRPQLPTILFGIEPVSCILDVSGLFSYIEYFLSLSASIYLTVCA